MGRAPCCDKANVKKGPWSPEEDAKLKSFIEQHGTGGNWIALPQKIGLKRCGKSCRLRWLNYLRPNIKHGGFSEEEDNIICSLYVSIGSRWSVIAAQLPGRTDNDIKNYWNTRLKKKLLGKHRRGNRLKQEVNRGNGDSSLPESSSHQQPYWPQMPVLAPLPCSYQQEPCFNDQDSIRKLLIKLGGRFSHDYQPTHDGLNFQFPYATHDPSTRPIYEEQGNMVSSAACMNAIDNNPVQLPQGTGLNLMQGGCFTQALEAMVSTYPRSLDVDGLEFLYGEDMIGDKIGPTSWCETNSLVHPPNYECMRQETPMECAFQELRYPGAQ